MRTKVYILATCLNGNLCPTLLTFRTLRVGFPTADVTVFGNALSIEPLKAVKSECARTKCEFVPLRSTSHDEWMSALVERAAAPFWACDTDMVFHASVETFANENTVMKGRYEPAFVEPWSKTVKAERLHTCLLYLNAPVIRHQMCSWIRQWHPPLFPFAPKIELVRQTYVPAGAGKPPTFYDTCAGLFQSIGGERFSEEENMAFDHLHCATYVERMKGVISGLQEAHNQIYQRPEDSVYLKANQNEFYERQKVYA